MTHQHDQAAVSLCDICGCMTHTLPGDKCGKCGQKPKSPARANHSGGNQNNSTPPADTPLEEGK